MHYFRAVCITFFVVVLLVCGVVWGMYVLGDTETVQVVAPVPAEEVYSFMQYSMSSDGGIHPWGDLVVLQECLVKSSEVGVVYVYRE